MACVAAPLALWLMLFARTKLPLMLAQCAWVRFGAVILDELQKAWCVV